MESFFVDIDYRDPAWIAIAFAFGLLFARMKLPPMIGFLTAGFVLHALGVESDRFLREIADLGVTLLLFTIGLKLRLPNLVRTETLATAISHMGITVVVMALGLMLIGGVGVLLFDGITLFTALLIAFSLSFSSTVFAVKTLEDRGSVSARYGQIAIGILVLQDIAAVAFVAFSAGKLPSVWAIGLLALIPARHLLGKLLQATGHGELLAVFGFAMALSGAAVFELVGLKGDLGALFFGAMLAPYAKSVELARTLLTFKEVFLVCFFLTIGLTGLPTIETFATSLLLLVFLPFRTALYYWLFTRFKLRARRATLSSLVLSNYSEFGLIVMVIAVNSGMLATEWITVMAVTVSLSFLLAAPLNAAADDIYTRFKGALRRFEKDRRLPGDEDINLDRCKVVIFGMGRVGLGAYDELQEQIGENLIGIDQDENKVAKIAETGRRVVLGDATNPEFWSRLRYGQEVKKAGKGIELILLALPNHAANLLAAKQFRSRGYQGPIVATAKYHDEVDSLKAGGVDEVYNIYAEAGSATATRMQPFLNITTKT